MRFLQDASKQVKLLMGIIFIGIIMACVIFDNSNKIISKEKNTPQNLIIMQYDQRKLNEKVSLYRIDDNKLKGIKETYLLNIRKWNRNPRYIQKDGNLVYFQTLEKVFLKGFYCEKPKGDSHDIQLYSNNKRFSWSIDPIYVERDLRTGEEKKILFFYFLMRCPPTYKIRYRRKEFFQSNIENDIFNTRGFGTLTFYATKPGSHCNKLFANGYPSYWIFKGLNNCYCFDSFNPLMSINRKLIAIDVAKIRNIASKKIIKEMNICNSEDSKSQLSNGKISINRNGWSILTAKRESLEKPDLLVSNFRLFKRGVFPSQIPHKCWSPSSDKLLFVGALEKQGVGNVYSVDIDTKKIEKVLDVNDTSGEFNPYLEWTEHGILITCSDKMFFKPPGKKIKKINLPPSITNLKNGRISPDGDMIMFFGKKNNIICLFILNLKTNKITEEILDTNNMDCVQGSWIHKNRISTIKNRVDYVEYHRMEEYIDAN